MICVKTPYADRATAMRALQKMIKAAQREKRAAHRAALVRIIEPCSRCGMYHISQPGRNGHVRTR